jgi:hypothetical protein
MHNNVVDKAILYYFFLDPKAATCSVTLNTSSSRDAAMIDADVTSRSEINAGHADDEVVVAPIHGLYTCPNSSTQYEYTIECLISDAHMEFLWWLLFTYWPPCTPWASRYLVCNPVSSRRYERGSAYMFVLL